MNTRNGMKRLGLTVATALMFAGIAWAQDAVITDDEDAIRTSGAELPRIEVIGTTPLPALGTPLNKVPGNAQSLNADDVEDQNPVDVSEAMYRNLGSVSINTSQNNPFQNDLFYRGFLASPLVGSAIGLSIYQDGVRINEGFGDTINWDLIPQSAISSIDVIPGSNPLFGLNTLGGALAIRTKSGFTDPGTELGAFGGSFDRVGATIEHGGHTDSVDWYVTGNYLDEEGWREFSPTELYQAFGKVGWANDKTDLDLSYAFADTDLTGNGFVPESTIARDRDAVHTFPDNILNELNFVNLTGTHFVSDELLGAANVYFRDYKQNTLNGDAEVACVDEADEEIDIHLGLCESAGGELETEGEDRMTATNTDSYGGTLQTTYEGELAGFGNSFTVGAAYDQLDSQFTQSEAESEIVTFGDSRGTEVVGEFETEIDVDTSQENVGVYFTDTFDITEPLALTLSGRYQQVDVEISDNTGEPENQDLNGEHDFDRFNPAAGLTYEVAPELNFFGGYSEGFRVPTPAELTCADPNDPCNLPNAFVADPPLDPVIARTYEAGARGDLPFGEQMRWNVSFFRTDLDDDLLFTIVETGGGGFFQNIGETRRQGVELGLLGRYSALGYYFSYAYVDATYESAETLASVVEPDGVQVQAGDRIPGIPEHNFKVGAEYSVLSNWWIGGDVQAATETFLRGDDSNVLPTVDGYAVLNLNTRVQFAKYFELWGRVDNVLDSEYETAGIRNFNAFGDPITEERFVAPGAPIAGWVGLKVRFGDEES